MKSIKLHIWFPLFVFAAFALILLVSALVQRDRLMKQIERGGISVVTDTLESTSRHIALFQNRAEYVDVTQAEISAISLKPNVELVVFVNADGMIEHASDLALRGRKAEEVIANFKAAKAAAGTGFSAVIDALGGHVIGYTAIGLPKLESEIRSSQTGSLYFSYDMSYEKNNLVHILIKESLLTWFAGILLMLFLEWGIRRWLIHPLAYLGTIMSSLSLGDYAVRADMQGSGELAQLAAVFNKLSAELNATLRAIPDLIFELSEEGTYLKVFGGKESLLVAPASDLIGKNVADFLPEEASSRVMAAIAQAKTKGTSQGNTFSLNVPSGKIWFEISVAKKVIDASEQASYILISRDITARKKAQLDLEESVKVSTRALDDLRLQKFALDQHSIVAITDAQFNIIYANKKFCEISQYEADELLGKNHRILNSGCHPREFFAHMYREITAGRVWHGELQNRAKDGSFYWVNTTIVPFMGGDGRVQQYIAIRTDMTAMKASEIQIRQLAFYDTLTGLPNRRLLHDRLKQSMANSARSKCNGALMFLDLDHFKDINDTQGHETGDKLLNEVARRLTSGVREGDTVSRLGGDEFVVILDSLDLDISVALSQASSIAEKIRTAIAHVYRFDEQEFEVGVSIGIVVFNNHDEDLNDLLKHADAAMYRAKNDGRNIVRFYDPQMQHILEARTSLLNDLRIAVRENQFELYYQAQAEHSDVIHLYAAEVLIRWNHPLRGFVSPAEFIPLAEESGLILPIGLWVLETACRQLQIWKTTPKLRYIRLSVNVSARQFREKDFSLTIKNLIQKYAIDATMLKLELTESLVINDIEGCIEKMLEIKKLGVSFSLDDFGTGYSSLTYLKRLPLDQIKIDQSFVREITSNSSDAAIVGAIIAIGQAMGVSIIAEGVETYAQQKFMEDHGCHQFQGYLFSKPLSVQNFENLIQVY